MRFGEHELDVAVSAQMSGTTDTKCEHNYQWSKYCGADVCSKCNDHKGLARCFCGWPAGEKLEDDIGEATWNPEEESWDVDY